MRGPPPAAHHPQPPSSFQPPVPIHYQPPPTHSPMYQPPPNHNQMQQPPPSHNPIHQPPPPHGHFHQPLQAHNQIHQSPQMHNQMHQPPQHHNQPSQNHSQMHQPPPNHSQMQQPQHMHQMQQPPQHRQLQQPPHHIQMQQPPPDVNSTPKHFYNHHAQQVSYGSHLQQGSHHPSQQIQQPVLSRPPPLQSPHTRAPPQPPFISPHSYPPPTQQVASRPPPTQQVASHPPPPQQVASHPPPSQQVASHPPPSQQVASHPPPSQQVASHPPLTQPPPSRYQKSPSCDARAVRGYNSSVPPPTHSHSGKDQGRQSFKSFPPRDMGFSGPKSHQQHSQDSRQHPYSRTRPYSPRGRFSYGRSNFNEGGKKPFSCDACNKSFSTKEMMDKHLEEHETCGLDGCSFTGHPKIVAKHIEMQHWTGLMRRIGKVETPEEIEKWRAERRKKFPTLANIEKKKAEEAEKMKRGEVLPRNDRNRRPSTLGSWRGGRGGGLNFGQDRGRGRGRGDGRGRGREDGSWGRGGDGKGWHREDRRRGIGRGDNAGRGRDERNGGPHQDGKQPDESGGKDTSADRYTNRNNNWGTRDGYVQRQRLPPKPLKNYLPYDEPITEGSHFGLTSFKGVEDVREESALPYDYLFQDSQEIEDIVKDAMDDMLTTVEKESSIEIRIHQKNQEEDGGVQRGEEDEVMKDLEEEDSNKFEEGEIGESLDLDGETEENQKGQKRAKRRRRKRKHKNCSKEEGEKEEETGVEKIQKDEGDGRTKVDEVEMVDDAPKENGKKNEETKVEETGKEGDKENDCSVAKRIRKSDPDEEGSYDKTQRKRTDDKYSANFQWRHPRYTVNRRKHSLLENLLKHDIRHERNVLFQCIRYIVANNFFDQVCEKKLDCKYPCCIESTVPVAWAKRPQDLHKNT